MLEAATAAAAADVCIGVRRRHDCRRNGRVATVANGIGEVPGDKALSCLSPLASQRAYASRQLDTRRQLAAAAAAAAVAARHVVGRCHAGLAAGVLQTLSIEQRFDILGVHNAAEHAQVGEVAVGARRYQIREVDGAVEACERHSGHHEQILGYLEALGADLALVDIAVVVVVVVVVVVKIKVDQCTRERHAHGIDDVLEYEVGLDVEIVERVVVVVVAVVVSAKFG